MRYIGQFFNFWYKFIVGDDWRIAAGVGATLGSIGFVAHYAHLQIWWLLPLLVVALLTLSLWAAVKRL